MLPEKYKGMSQYKTEPYIVDTDVNDYLVGDTPQAQDGDELEIFSCINPA